jgi:hypothetical protein
VAFEDRPVTEQFTRAAPRELHWPWRALMVKTLYRRAAFARPGIHRPRDPLGKPVWPDPRAADRLLSEPGRDHYRVAQLNHYALGSVEGFLVKCDRGRANRETGPLGIAYWCDRNFCSDEDRSILALDSRALRDELMADRELARLHRAGVAWRQRRFAELMRDEPWRALFGRLLMTPPIRPLTAEVAARIRRYRAT